MSEFVVPPCAADLTVSDEASKEVGGGRGGVRTFAGDSDQLDEPFINGTRTTASEEKNARPR